MEKIADVLHQTKPKQYSLCKAMLTFLLEWKDLETHLDLTQKCFQQRLTDQTCRENHLHAVQESVTQSSKELDTIRKSIEKRFQEVEQKENEFLLFQQNWIKEFESKEKNMGLALKGMKLREEGVNEQEKLIAQCLEEVKMERKIFEDMRKSVDERVKEMRVIQKCTEDVRGDLQSMEKEFEARFEEIKIEKEKLKAREEELESREKNLNSIQILKPTPSKKCDETAITSDINVGHSKKVCESRSIGVEDEEVHVSVEPRPRMDNSASMIQNATQLCELKHHQKEQSDPLVFSIKRCSTPLIACNINANHSGSSGNVEAEEAQYFGVLSKSRKRERVYLGESNGCKRLKVMFYNDDPVSGFISYSSAPDYYYNRYVQMCTEDVHATLRLMELRFEEIQFAKENTLHGVTQSSNELKTIRNSIEKRFQEVELKENEFNLFQTKWIREFELKEKNMGLIQKEVKLREEGVNEQEKLIEKQLEEIKRESERTEGMRKSVEEMSLKQKCAEDSLCALRSVEKELELDFKKFELEKVKLKAREKDVELREKYVNSIHKVKSETSANVKHSGYGKQVSEDISMVPIRYYESPRIIMERKVITCIEAKIGQSLRKDGPILGVEFVKVPPGAFGKLLARS